MSIRPTRSAAGCILAAVLLASVLIAAPSANALACASGKKEFVVTSTVTSGKDLTAVLMSATGQTLTSTKITADSQSITLRTACVKTIAGATIQLVNSRTNTLSSAPTASSGDYFGPVTLGWKGTTRTSATVVYTKFKEISGTSPVAVTLGPITVEKVTGKKSGYAYTTSNRSTGLGVLADSSTAAAVKATAGKPAGVGNYGKARTDTITIASTLGPLADPPPPSGTITADDSTGGDKDDDGIPNAFDVNDDGDIKIDSADNAGTPAPKVQVEAAKAGTGVADGATCAPVDFRIFTNFKATQPRFAGSINYYAPEPFKATTAVDANSIQSTIGRSMTMVFSKITNVCGSQVTKTELKGVGVPYAPADYVQLGQACGNQQDYQWQVGAGKICGSATFGSAYTFTANDLPSGQDTFSMRITTANGGVYEFTASPGFVFVTHPMLIGYALTTDGTSDENTQPTQFTSIDYTQTTNGPDGPALSAEPSISLARNKNIWLKIYRPQRFAIEGECLGLCTFMDIGGFKYTPDIPNGATQGSHGPGKCDALSTTDTAFTDTPVTNSTPPTLVLKWNISACYGVPPSNTSWIAGATDFDIQVEPLGPGGNAAQKIRLTLTGS